jgi:CHASE1-domain containing sensor protein
VKKALNLKALAALAFAGVGLMLGLGLSGCKSAPELTAAQAQALIQAKYDQTPAVGANITVDDLGMRMGVTAKYWDRSKAYPNKFWADFTLTPEGKKAIKLADGSDVIKWRPESTEDKSFSVIVVTTAANHLKARDVKDPVDEVGGTKSVIFTEAVNLDGVPSALQDIAHNPGNKLSGKKTATFALDNGAWKLVGIV